MNKTIQITSLTYKQEASGFRIYSCTDKEQDRYMLWVPKGLSDDISANQVVRIEQSTAEGKEDNWKVLEIVSAEETVIPRVSNLHYLTGQLFVGLCGYYKETHTPDQIMDEAVKLAIKHSSQLDKIVKARG